MDEILRTWAADVDVFGGDTLDVGAENYIFISILPGNSIIDKIYPNVNDDKKSVLYFRMIMEQAKMEVRQQHQQNKQW